MAPFIGELYQFISTRNTILLIGHCNTFWESRDASPSFSFTLQTTPVESGSVSTILVIGYLFLMESSLSKTTWPTSKFHFWLFHLYHTCNVWGKFFPPSCPKFVSNVIDIWSQKCSRWCQNNISGHSEKMTWWQRHLTIDITHCFNCYRLWIYGCLSLCNYFSKVFII